MPCPLECTKSCQQCYEGVIAGVIKYACYGQCVVVDAYGMKHLGPGEAAPAGWTRSAGDSMAEMIANEIANINNSEPTPTIIKETTCFSKGKPCYQCGTNCWINRSDQVPYECYCGEQPKLQDGTPNPKWKKFKNPNTQEVDRLTQTTVEEQKAALTVARLNFNKRGGGGTPVPVIPKQYTTVTCDPKWCTCQGVPGCGDGANCGGQCYWVNHPRVGGTSEPPGACRTCNFKCSMKGAPPESDEDDILVIRETEQVPKVALAKARRAANFDKSVSVITNTSCKGTGTCYACNSAGCDCGSRNTCYERYRPNEDGLYPNVWYHECVCSLNKPIGGAGTGWRRKTQEIKPTTIPKDTPWPEDTEPVNNV